AFREARLTIIAGRGNLEGRWSPELARWGVAPRDRASHYETIGTVEHERVLAEEVDSLCLGLCAGLNLETIAARLKAPGKDLIGFSGETLQHWLAAGVARGEGPAYRFYQVARQHRPELLDGYVKWRLERLEKQPERVGFWLNDPIVRDRFNGLPPEITGPVLARESIRREVFGNPNYRWLSWSVVTPDMRLERDGEGQARVWIADTVHPYEGDLQLPPDYETPDHRNLEYKADWEAYTPGKLKEESDLKAQGSYWTAIERGRNLHEAVIVEFGGGGWTPIADRLVSPGNGNRYVNVDLNEPGLHTQAGSLGADCHGLLADFTFAPLRDGCADMIVSVASLTPSLTPDAVLLKAVQEGARVLKPGGEWVFGGGYFFSRADPKVIKTILRWFEPVALEGRDSLILRRRPES
ncbi:MAG: class I SAM-dependent methyltransferase, partial [Candidatus Eremiobacterota bacterium]